MTDTRLQKDITSVKKKENMNGFDNLVLEKSIFSNVFDKDIRRVYIYKKAERIAKALHMIAPAFKDAKMLRERFDRIALGLVDASVLPPSESREALSRELLALSSLLAIARTGSHLSAMNADIIVSEAGNLLQEIAAYEDPKVLIDEMPTLATLSRSLPRPAPQEAKPAGAVRKSIEFKGQDIGQSGATLKGSSRRDTILSVLKTKGPSYIKDLSTLFRDVSEKTIQRELQALVAEGVVQKAGERRWTTYTLANANG